MSTIAQNAQGGSTATKRSRLMITKMVLENFKSYAGSQEIGPFHKRFSSIVGPNGSGKSNVIDALLFVFGKRAKQLRLNKVSELIHKSSGFPNLEYAKVSVHFQMIDDYEESEDDFDVIPGSEFIVSRTALKNNQSKYTVDAKNSTYTEVGTLLRSYGIDLDNNRFLILQGEVEQIAMMKPKAQTPHEEGLLEYLEDIIGSNRFVERIELSSKALEEISEQRVEKVNRLKVAEKERDNLSGSKIEAEAFIEKEKDIRRKRNMLCQLMEHTANGNVRDYSERLEKVQGKLNYERSKMADSEERLKVIEAEYQKIKAEHTAVNTDLQNSTTEYDSFERKDVKLQEDMKHAKALIKKQQATIAKEQKKEADCSKEAEELMVQIQKYEQLLVDYEEKKAAEEKEVEKIMESLQEATHDLRQSLEVAQTELAAQEKSVAVLQTEKESVVTAMQLVQKRSEDANKAVAAIEEKLQVLQAEHQRAQQEITNLEGTGAKEVSKQIKSTEAAIAKCSEEETSLQSQLREATRDAEMAKAALQAQEQRKNSGGKNSVVQRLLQAAKKGGPLAHVGIRGRLGDLATIDDQYDVAVSTACGMLDHIVVDTADAGQTCIAYLRDHNIGRASFITLDQMQEWQSRMQRKVTLPAGAARLFDLINVSNAAVLPAFYMALKDTLVATDLDQAVKISYQGDRAVWRVVTLDGNLIDTSGAMSGGGKETRSGSMLLASGSTVRQKSSASSDEEVTPAQVRVLEGKVVELQNALTDCRKRKIDAEKTLLELQKQQKASETEIEKKKMALARFAEQESELSTRLGQAQNECSLLPEEKSQLQQHQSQLDCLEGEIGTVAPNLRSLQGEVASIQRQIKSVGGPKLVKAQQKIDSLVSQLDSFATSLSTKKVEESNARKQSEKSAALCSKAEQEVTKAEQKLSDLVAEQKEMETDALVVVTAVEAAKEKLAVLEEQLQGSSKEFSDIRALVAKVKSVEVDLNVELERVTDELKQAKATTSRWRHDGEHIRKQHVDEQREFNSVVKSVSGTENAPTSATAASTADEEEAAAVDMSLDESPIKESKTGNIAIEEDDGIERLAIFTVEELQMFDGDELKRDINIMETERNKMKGNVNMNALLEYMRKDAAYKSRLGDLEQVTETRNTMRRQHEELRRQRLDEFMSGFGVISLKLKEMYQMITLGGDAELELLDSLDPFSEGIVFSVRPPRKSWKNISNLSGGEKTLSSLALVFALHHYKPTPLYVMDEIDAALDFKNVSIVANYIKDRTKDAQFVIISLRNNMFELADRLVGIYKTHDATKSVTINPKMFENSVATSVNKTTSTAAAVGGNKSAMPLSDATNTAATVARLRI